MYNYQKFLQQSRVSSEFKKIQRQYRHTECLRAQRAHEMIIKHDKRVEHSILTLIDKPTIVNNYKDPAYHPREEDKTKRVVECEMFFNYEKEPIRIIRTMQRNSSLDSIPFNNCFAHHFREESPKERNRKTIATIEQASNFIKKENNGQNTSTHSKLNKQGRKMKRFDEYLPRLHDNNPKTYFHTLETLINKPSTAKQNSQNKINSEQANSPINSSKVGIQIQSGQIQKTNNENKLQQERVKLQKIKKCRLALQKCGLLPKEGFSQTGISIRKSSVR